MLRLKCVFTTGSTTSLQLVCDVDDCKADKVCD